METGWFRSINIVFTLNFDRCSISFYKKVGGAHGEGRWVRWIFLMHPAEQSDPDHAVNISSPHMLRRLLFVSIYTPQPAPSAVGNPQQIFPSHAPYQTATLSSSRPSPENNNDRDTDDWNEKHFEKLCRKWENPELMSSFGGPCYHQRDSVVVIPFLGGFCGQSSVCINGLRGWLGK